MTFYAHASKEAGAIMQVLNERFCVKQKEDGDED
jgi:hypothetical protein